VVVSAKLLKLKNFEISGENSPIERVDDGSPVVGGGRAKNDGSEGSEVAVVAVAVGNGS
jgi:hypothetical protein